MQNANAVAPARDPSGQEAYLKRDAGGNIVTSGSPGGPPVASSAPSASVPALAGAVRVQRS